MNPPRQRAMMLFLVVLFAVPLLAALVMRFADWSPGRTGNHGELVAPPVRLAVPEGSALAEYWVLVFTPDGTCGPDCRETFDALRRIRIGLGDQAHRLKLVHAGGADVTFGDSNAPDVSGAPWFNGLRAAAPGGLRPNAAYLIDPRGFFMMWYPPGFSAGGVLDDLERLLRYSRVGVQ